MMTANRSFNINQIVKNPENTGRAGLVLILSNVTNKTKDNQSSFINRQNHSIIIVVPDIMLNKLLALGLACATQKAPHQKQNP